jgi:hypothetical protein
MGPLIRFGEADDRLMSLLEKSLVVATSEQRTFRYRLLDTTRAYGQDKLQENGEASSSADVAPSTSGQSSIGPTRNGTTAPQRSGYEPMNASSATCVQPWIGPSRKTATAPWAAGLTTAAAPIWFHLSLLDEGLSRVERAIAWLKDQPTPDRRIMMQLYAISGWPQLRAIKGIPSGAAAWRETLVLANELDDVDYQLRALWVDRNNNGEAAEALTLADRFAVVAERAGDSQDRMIGQRMRGKSLHDSGDFVGSRREIEQMLDRYAPPPQRSHLIRFQYDQRLTAQITLDRGLWLQGHADQALVLVEQMIAESLALDHILTRAHVLSDAACFTALWAGDLPLATRYAKMLRDHTTLHALDVWRTYADAFEGEILIRQRNAHDGIATL